MYKFRCISWVNGKVTVRDVEMSSTELYQETSKVGLTAFLLLLNKWNSSFAANGENKAGAIHKYFYTGDE